MSYGPRRFTAQIQQEHVSRNQFKERLTEFGWLVVDPPDLGEDFIIHVYFDGRASGITFHVQIKSVTNLFERQKDTYIPYPFPVKDLKHWGNFDQPVVLIVWDVETREGRWILAGDAIRQLDIDRPRWRGNKTKSIVHIPWANDTSDSGLENLRIEIGMHFYPLISKGKKLQWQLKTTFPITEDGTKAHEDFEKFFREGEPVVVEGQYIEAINISDWWSRWFVPSDSHVAKIVMGPSIDFEGVNARIEFLGSNGQSALFENVNLRRIRSGSELLVLNNEHQSLPIHFLLEFRKQSGGMISTFTWTTSPLGNSVTDTVRIINLYEVLVSGGKIIITLPGITNKAITKDFLPQELPVSIPFIEFVRKLYQIQNITGYVIEIPAKLEMEEVNFVHELYKIVTEGKVCRVSPQIPFSLTKEGLQIIADSYHDSDVIDFLALSEAYYAEIFNVKIPLGKLKRTMRGRLDMDIHQLQEVITSLNGEDIITVHLLEAAVSDEYEKWIKHSAVG